MSDVSGLHRAATMLWVPGIGEVLPVRRLQELEAYVSGWRDYGQAAAVHSQTSAGRAGSLTSIGMDGWLVRLRDRSMIQGDWPCSMTVTRLMEDGTLPSLMGDSPWYAPDNSTDLAGRVLIAEQIQVNPAPVAACLWAWLTDAPMPSGFAVGKPGYDPVHVNSVGEALDFIGTSTGQAWPIEARRAAVELAAELEVNRVVVTSPGQLSLRIPSARRRVLVQCRGKGVDRLVRVVGMTDDLGHEYSMSLPDRQIIRVSRKRRA